MKVEIGARIDRYQVLSQIGRGGMGEVYLAQDSRLGRKVALKLLPAQYTEDAERLRRFEQEALTASALNHPNIVTIYEVGEVEGRPFIATEYIEGATLRRRMASGRLSMIEALEIATQVVSALAAAHAAGIVHRDIKPENIMIRPDGYVKVLDFGLAKLTERTGGLDGADAQLDSGENQAITTEDLVRDEKRMETAGHAPVGGGADRFATIAGASPSETAPGVVMGTAQYMSPEQARGIRVDARTDIFSFGIVLYEMLAGRTPFAGVLSREIIDSILSSDPPPLSEINPDIPEVMEWIVAKALVKDREERYQSCKEMLNDLKRLSRRLNVESEVLKTRGRTSAHEEAVERRQGNSRSGEATREMATQTGAMAAFRSSGFFAQMLKDSRGDAWNRPLIIALALCLAVVGSLSVYQFIRSKRKSAEAYLRMELRRITTTGKASRAAVSPDGKYVVHVHGDVGNQSLHVRQVMLSNSVEIVPPANVIYRGLTFSPDGNLIYYVVQEGSNPIQSLYQVPVLGGTTRKILTNIDSPVAISPDRRQLAFVRRYRGKSEDALILTDIEGRSERELTTRKGNDFFGVSGAEWAPDGKTIACPAGTNTGGRHMYIALIDVAEGRQRQLWPKRWASVGRLSWLQDGKGMVASAVEQGSTLAQIWHLSYPKGEARRITNDLNDYRDLSLTADSRALATVQSEAHVNVWLLSAGDLSRPKKITEGIGQYNGVRGLTWLPDGRMVYVSRITGSQDLWIMNQEGKGQRQLTTPETRADIYPSVTPDGRHVVFVSTQSGNSNIYRLDIETGELKRLTSGTSDEFPAVTPDGRSVIYTQTGATKFTLWRVGIDGGEPVQLTTELSSWPAISPDGQRLACWYRGSPASPWKIAILPIAGGAPESLLDVPPSTDTSIPIRWAPDGQNICFSVTKDGASNIWQRPTLGGEPKQLTSFTTDQIFWFDWSRDGKLLACSRGAVTSDVVLISEFTP
ncbi:MAG: protein kinase [Blastocatellia bacterium]|nr:protein kinase [Blastocatellia bacterium]